jgi:hypothetical protein
MTAKTELMLAIYNKRFFVPTCRFEPPSSEMNSRRLMLNLSLPESVYCTLSLP